jgi:hypothetical protein
VVSGTNARNAEKKMSRRWFGFAIGEDFSTKKHRVVTASLCSLIKKHERQEQWSTRSLSVKLGLSLPDLGLVPPVTMNSDSIISRMNSQTWVNTRRRKHHQEAKLTITSSSPPLVSSSRNERS